MRDNLKHLAAIATAVAAIAASAVALLKKSDEPRAEKSYELLAEKIGELQAASRKQHEDVVALRAYLDGYLTSMRDAQEKLAAVQLASSITKRPVRATVTAPPRPALPRPAPSPKLEPPPAEAP